MWVVIVLAALVALFVFALSHQRIETTAQEIIDAGYHRQPSGD